MPVSSVVRAVPRREGETLKDTIKTLPLPVQLLINAAFALLLLVDVVVPDMLPLFDELLLVWLLFVSSTATATAFKERREARRLATPGAAIDVRDQQAAVERTGAPPSAGDPLQRAAERELEALEGAPF